MKRFKLRYADLSTYRAELMGISIIGILLCHMSECRILHDLPIPVYAKLLGKLTAFVDVFMLISGLGLYYSYSRRSEPVFFYRKRVSRLLPVYLLIAAPYWIWRDMIADGQGLARVLYDLCFVSCVRDGLMRFWFVFAIFVFYLLFPAIYRFIFTGKREGLRAALAVLLSVAGSRLISWAAPGIYGHMQIMIDRVPAFILGAWAGRQAKRDEEIKPWMLILVAALCLATQAMSVVDRLSAVFAPISYYSATCLGIALMLAAIFALKLIRVGAVSKALRRLGGVTLEVYLFHSLLKNVFDYPAGTGKYLLVAVAMPIVFGFAAHWLIDRIMRLGKNHARI